MSAEEIHTFLHCRQCSERRQSERLEVGFTRSGIRVQCPKHGLVGHFTPEDMPDWFQPQCECCPGGRHEPAN